VEGQRSLSASTQQRRKDRKAMPPHRTAKSCFPSVVITNRYDKNENFVTITVFTVLKVVVRPYIRLILHIYLSKKPKLNVKNCRFIMFVVSHVRQL